MLLLLLLLLFSLKAESILAEVVEDDNIGSPLGDSCGNGDVLTVRGSLRLDEAEDCFWEAEEAAGEK